MPKPPTDRFDDLPESGRVGAHRAHNPRVRVGVMALWSLAVAAVLIAVGIFAALVITGRVTWTTPPTPTPTVAVTAAPTLDPSYQVLVMNATPQQGLATRMSDELVAAGWAPGTVLASDAGADDFPETTVYYAAPGDEGVARGIAELIGGAVVAQSDRYQPAGDPEARQVAVVIGLDRVADAPAS